MNKKITPLEALKELRYRITNFNGKFHNYNELMGTIETAIIQAQKDKKELEEIKSAINQGAMISQWSHDYQHEKELKALEIIKKHIDLEDYDTAICILERKLTTEEYDLLKEALL